MTSKQLNTSKKFVTICDRIETELKHVMHGTELIAGFDADPKLLGFRLETPYESVGKAKRALDDVDPKIRQTVIRAYHEFTKPKPASLVYVGQKGLIVGKKNRSNFTDFTLLVVAIHIASKCRRNVRILTGDGALRHAIARVNKDHGIWKMRYAGPDDFGSSNTGTPMRVSHFPNMANLNFSDKRAQPPRRNY